MTDAGHDTHSHAGGDAVRNGMIRTHAYDPLRQPEFFDGVVPRRIMAFLIDLVILAVPVILLAFFILLFGIVTLGLGLMLFWLLPAAATIWALVYYGVCFAGVESATLGMRMMDLEMRTWYGGRSYFLLGAVHAVGYWISVSALTPFILLVCLFNARRRLLHDMLLGTIVVNNEARARSLRLAGVTGPSGPEPEIIPPAR